jgi:hypothetical protein
MSFKNSSFSPKPDTNEVDSISFENIEFPERRESKDFSAVDILVFINQEDILFEETSSPIPQIKDDNYKRHNPEEENKNFNLEFLAPLETDLKNLLRENYEGFNMKLRVKYTDGN